MRKEKDKSLRLFTVRQFSEANPAFSQGSLRHLIHRRRKIGFEFAVVRIGRRVLIDAVAFERWVRSQNEIETSNKT